MLRREIVSHWQLRHRNVLPLTGIYLEASMFAPWMIVPLMEHGSASKYLKNVGFGALGTRFSEVVRANDGTYNI